MPEPDHPHAAALPPEAYIRPVDRPKMVALRVGFWLLVGFGAVALPFAVLLSGAVRPAPKGVLWDFAMGAGFAALALTALQFALTGRIKWLTNPFGADIVYVFHRFLSWGAVALMALHFGVLYLWYQPALGELNPLSARWELTAGRVALLCFGLLIVTSELRKWLKIEYHFWRVMHVMLAVTGFAAALAHVLGVGNYSAMADTLALWLGVTVVWFGFVIWSRLIRPMVQMAHGWRVVANVAERGGVHTLTLRPDGAGLRMWRPGQFAWLAVGNSPYTLREHPFTISSAPEQGPEIAFSIKPLGDDSERLAKTPVGARAYVDGPFGTFTVDREGDAAGFVMIAGGIGITPVMANLAALCARGDRRRVILLYANKTLEDAPFREELAQMAREIDLKVVHVPEAAPEGWQGEVGMIDADILARHLPAHSRDWPHMLCGPAPMTKAVIAALRRMGVPKWRIDLEAFEIV